MDSIHFTSHLIIDLFFWNADRRALVPDIQESRIATGSASTSWGVGMRLCLVGLVAVCLPAVGEVRLPHVLSDHAVLQREQPVRIWGWGAPTEKIKVRFHDQTLMGQADV